MTTGSGVRVLETFTFSAEEMPYSIMGYWGCAFRLCPHGQIVKPGQECHKIQIGEDVDLVHTDCLVALRKAMGVLE